MDIRSFAFRTYNRYDGLQGNEFTQNAFYRNPQTGELFFGGTNGLNAFFPDQIKLTTAKPAVVFTGLKIMNQPIDPGSTYNRRVVLQNSLLTTDELTLTWEDMNFSIGFSSLNYENPYGCRYRYKLVGLDKDWLYTDALVHEATFTHLPAGKYKLQVEAANSDGLWSEKAAVLNLVILPPWWWSWWTKLIYFSILMVLGWLIYRYLRTRIEFRNRLMLERLKNEKNEELMNMKLQFFTEISHEFRTPLTLIIDPMMRSGLVFSGANKSWGKSNENQAEDDGILTANEISNLDLSACQLVVLSACETGLGEVKGSEGVFGLQRAFKMAGVKNIIMSLWKVPDTQTAELFNIFYSECFAGKTIHEAFKIAQSIMKEKYSPYYWAGFVLLE
jgi:hypothetical protein